MYGMTVLNMYAFSVYTNVLSHHLNRIKKISFCHWMNMIAVHALIIFSEIIGFGSSTICIIFFFYTEKKLQQIFMHMQFCRF